MGLVKQNQKQEDFKQMANFKQAVKWMKEGKKVHIPNWIGDKPYWYIDGYLKHKKGHGIVFNNLNNISSNKWEIYDDKKYELLQDIIEDIRLLTPYGKCGAVCVTDVEEILNKRFGF